MILEGRKETLIDKHGDMTEIMDFLALPFQVKTNFKYTDWALTVVDIDKLNEVNELLITFDKVSKNLDIKDINRYNTYEELETVITKYLGGRKKTVNSSESIKVVDNDDVMVVRPLSYEASCKYGAGTKWCTTDKSDKYFKKYTRNGVLYYISLKKFGIENPFYKMAVHINTYSGAEEWYNALDDRMGRSEIRLAKMIFGESNYELMIRDKQREVNNKNSDNLINKVFEKIDLENWKLTKWVESEEVPELSTNFEFTLSSDYELYGSKLELKYHIESKSNYEDYLMGTLHLNVDNNVVEVKFDKSETNGLFKADNGVPNYQYNTNVDAFQKTTLIDIIERFIRKQYYTTENLSKFTGKKYWRSSNSMSTYTFNGNGRMTKLMKDYLNELGSEGLGSKIDFFLKTKTLVVKDGEYYTDKTSQSPIVIRGYFSTFFASLSDAGIIQYVRDGRQYKFKQGPNYEDYLKGNLQRK